MKLRIVSGMLLLALLSGCNTTHRDLDLQVSQYRQGKIRNTARALSPEEHVCCFLRSVKDARSRDYTGALTTTLSQGDPTEWVEQGLLALSSEHFLVHKDPARESGCQIDVELVKAYVRGQSTNKIASVVLKVSVFDAQGNACYSDYYRGNKTAMNWSSSSSEITTALNIALEEAVCLFAQDLAMRQPAVVVADVGEEA